MRGVDVIIFLGSSWLLDASCPQTIRDNASQERVVPERLYLRRCEEKGANQVFLVEC